MGLKDLYAKVASFEATLSTSLNCKNGCSRCCYVDLSVFEVEAKLIRQWFNDLPHSRKEELREKWKGPLSEVQGLHGKQERSCSFLRNESCTIYEARPLICRTQGLALKFREGAEDLIDICPLNEELLNQMSGKEILNLDLINLILAQLEKLDSNHLPRQRVPLRELIQELSD